MIHLGKIAFANCDFPYYAIEHGKLQADDIEVIEGHPVELARKLEAEELDIGPISSIMYAKNDELLILPDLSITSNDFTKSVLICGNGDCEISDFEGKTLCIPETTASSAALITIIFRLRGLNVNIRQCSGTDIEKMLTQGDAALLIGDSAIKAIGKYRIIADLGNEWKKLTGKKMVYALWVTRRDFAEKYPEKVKYVHDILIRSRDFAYQNIDLIASHISQQKNIDRDFMQEYLHTLNYDFDMETIESLELFFKLARECGIIKDANLRFFRP